MLEIDTFLHKIGSPYSIPNSFLIAQVGVRHEGLVQPRPEVIEALGIVSAQVEELFVDRYDLPP